MSNSNSIEKQMAAILDDVLAASKESLEEGLRKVPRKVSKKLRSSSPKQYGGYSQGWTTTKTDGGVTVYNKSFPGLTHLLEKGHMSKNQYGSFRRVNGKPHIAPAAQEGIEEFVNTISQELDSKL